MFGEDELVKSHKHRADVLINIMLVLFAIILARLWYLQIYNGRLFYRYSLENQLRKEIVRAPRGMVLSRDSEPLIYNTPRFDAIIIPQYLKEKEKVLPHLAKILDMSIDKIEDLLEKSVGRPAYLPITVKKELTDGEVAALETRAFLLPGVSVNMFMIREYKDKYVGSHVLGYISEISQSQLPRYRKRDKHDYKLGDFIGQAGIEEQFDLDMRGIDGHEYMEVDARGRMKRYVDTGNEKFFSGIEGQEPIWGNNLRLTLDRDLQNVAYNSLEDRVGSAVVVDIHTGEILTMVSRPSYDSSRFSINLTADYWNSLIKDDKNPLRDRSIQEHYAPGSTFKPVTALAALEAGLIDDKTEVKCTGYLQFGRRRYHCWKRHGHGNVDVYKALRESCDVFFYRLAMRLDIDVLARYARMLGFGMKTGITLPYETTGLVPTKEWKKKRNGQDWQAGETLSCAIGQSYMLTTPLQLAQAYAMIANGGTLYKPYLVKDVFTNSGEVIKSVKPEIIQQVDFDKKNWDIVREGLNQVVNERTGTGWWYKGSGIHMAGKTGTAQVVKLSAEKLFSRCEEYEYKQRNHGLFAGYAPAENPRIAFAVIAEHSCHGGSGAAPVARDIVTAYMKKYHPADFAKNLEMDKKRARELQAMKLSGPMGEDE